MLGNFLDVVIEKVYPFWGLGIPKFSDYALLIELLLSNTSWSREFSQMKRLWGMAVGEWQTRQQDVRGAFGGASTREKQSKGYPKVPSYPSEVMVQSVWWRLQAFGRTAHPYSDFDPQLKWSTAYRRHREKRHLQRFWGVWGGRFGHVVWAQENDSKKGPASWALAVRSPQGSNIFAKGRSMLILKR